MSQHLAHSRLFNQQLCLNGYLCGDGSSVRLIEDQAKGEGTPRREHPRQFSGRDKMNQVNRQEEEGRIS